MSGGDRGFKSNAEEAQKTAQEAQRLLVKLISNLHRSQEQSHNHEEEGREMLERMDEARRAFDEAVEEMDEDQEKKHRESLNESTEMLPFYGLAKIDGMEEQKVEAGEDNQQEILTPPGKMNTGRDTEGELYSTKKRGEETSERTESRQGTDDQ